MRMETKTCPCRRFFVCTAQFAKFRQGRIRGSPRRCFAIAVALPTARKHRQAGPGDLHSTILQFVRQLLLAAAPHPGQDIGRLSLPRGSPFAAAEPPLFAHDHDVPPLQRPALKSETENLERKPVGLTAEAVPRSRAQWTPLAFQDVVLLPRLGGSIDVLDVRDRPGVSDPRHLQFADCSRRVSETIRLKVRSIATVRLPSHGK